jgi:hypothetical protein
MNPTTNSVAPGFHTWKDTFGCIAVLLAIVLSTVSGAYVIYTDSTTAATSTGVAATVALITAVVAIDHD